MIVLLFGPPGCGKGTQATFIASRCSIPAISTGEIFRAECKAGTRLGKLACSILASGGLVGDDIVNEIVLGRISQPDCAGGFLLDGYPRTVPQARFLSEVLRAKGLPEPLVIHLDVPAEVLVARLTARRQCPTCFRIYNLLSQPPKVDGVCDVDGAELVRRQDDREDVIRQRLDAYQEQAGPLLEYYGLAICRIDAARSPAEVWEQVKVALAQALALVS